MQTRLPVQKRSRKTYDLIVDAGMDLFSESGFHKTNSKQIARKAGVSIGSFYSYFKDKKSLYLEVLKRHENKVSEKVLSHDMVQLLDGIDGKATVTLMVNQVIAIHDLSPDFEREAISMRYSDADVQAIQDEGESKSQEMLVKLLESKMDELRIDDLEAASLVITKTVKEIVHSIKIFEPVIEKDRMVNELIDMLHRYLYK